MLWYTNRMEAILKADIFFFITSIVVVIISAVLLVALYYLIKILRDVGEISKIVKNESGLIVKDIDDVRKRVKKKGRQVGLFINKIVSSGSKRKGGHGKYGKNKEN